VAALDRQLLVDPLVVVAAEDPERVSLLGERQQLVAMFVGEDAGNESLAYIDDAGAQLECEQNDENRGPEEGDLCSHEHLL